MDSISELSLIAEEDHLKDHESGENQQFFKRTFKKSDTEKSLAGSRQTSRTSLFSQDESIESVVKVGDTVSENADSDTKLGMESNETDSVKNLLAVDTISIGSMSSNQNQNLAENSFGLEPVDKVAPDNALDQVFRLNPTVRADQPPDVLGNTNDDAPNSDDELLDELGQNTKKALAAMTSKKSRRRKDEMNAVKKLTENQARLGLKMMSTKDRAKEREKEKERKKQLQKEMENDCACDEIRKDPRLKTKVCTIM